MEPVPELKIGWLNGWLVIILLALTEGILFLAFPRQVTARLFDRSGWSQRQRGFTIAGKLCALIGLVKALFDFKDTPLDEPVTRGLSRVSRHPQIMMSSVVLLGGCIAIGSWVAVAFWAGARLLEHLGIVAEEEVCLKQY